MQERNLGLGDSDICNEILRFLVGAAMILGNVTLVYKPHFTTAPNALGSFSTLLF